jgi:hypothetical protein
MPQPQVLTRHEAIGDRSSAVQAYEMVARSARLADLVAIASQVITEAAAARRTKVASVDQISSLAADANLSRTDADTTFGNVLKVLESGAEGASEKALASAVWTHAVAEAITRHTDDETKLAADILWLATHTAFDALPLLDRALGEDADQVWNAIGTCVRRVDQGKPCAVGAAEAVVACASLAAASSPAARKAAHDLTATLDDPRLARLLRESVTLGPDVRFEGEAIAAPRGPIMTTVLALTGILFVLRGTRAFAKVALAYRCPSEVILNASGIRMKTRTVVLGRTLREREYVIGNAALVRVVRDVRYPSAAFYAGLIALALGSYLGLHTLVDGARAGSASLLLAGLVIVLLGLALDFALGTVLPGARGRVRVSFVPRVGNALCVAEVDAASADTALRSAFVTAKPSSV